MNSIKHLQNNCIQSIILTVALAVKQQQYGIRCIFINIISLEVFCMYLSTI